MADDTRDVAPRTHPGMFSGNVPKAAQVVTVVAVPDNANANTVWGVARIPSNARILPGSFVINTDLEAASDDPELDIGLRAVDGNITTDVDALNVDLSMDTAGTKSLLATTANWGKMAWEFVNAQTSDPGGFLDVILTLTDHAATEPGTLTVYLNYACD